MTSVSLSAEAHHHCRAGLPAQARHGRPARCLVQHRGHLVSLHGKGRNLAEEISRKFAGVGHEIKTKEMKEISIRWAGNLDLPQAGAPPASSGRPQLRAGARDAGSPLRVGTDAAGDSLSEMSASKGETTNLISEALTWGATCTLPVPVVPLPSRGQTTNSPTHRTLANDSICSPRVLRQTSTDKH